MSVRVMTLVFDAAFPDVAPKMIALKLADCANDDGDNIYPSRETVERATSCSKSTVLKYLKQLVDCGLLEVVHRSPGGYRRETTHRRFNMDLLRALANGDLELVFEGPKGARILTLKEVGESPRDDAQGGRPATPSGGRPESMGVAPRPLVGVARQLDGGRPATRWGSPGDPKPSLNHPLPTLSSAREGEQGNKFENVFARFTGPKADSVIEHFLRPVTQTIRVQHDQPKFLFEAIIQKLGSETPAVLAAAAIEVFEHRKLLVAPRDAFDAVDAVKRAKPAAKADSGTVHIAEATSPAAFAAWRIWAEANTAAADPAVRKRAAFLWRLFDQHRISAIDVPTEWPPDPLDDPAHDPADDPSRKIATDLTTKPDLTTHQKDFSQ